MSLPALRWLLLIAGCALACVRAPALILDAGLTVAAVLALGLVALRSTGPAAATAWALALLPLPASDAWANGGTDIVLCFALGGVMALLVAWVRDDAPLLGSVVLATVALTANGHGEELVSRRAGLGAALLLLVWLALTGLTAAAASGTRTRRFVAGATRPG